MTNTKYALPLAVLFSLGQGPATDTAKEVYTKFFSGRNKGIEQGVQTPSKGLESLLGREAYAEPVPSNEHKGYLEIDVMEYYKEATPRDDIMPGMKVTPFGSNQIFIKSNYGDGNPVTFKRGEFSKYYFGKKYGPDIKKIFEEGGINVDKLTKFLNAHKNEKSVALYSDGFMILFDDTERMAYMFPIGKEIAEKVFKL